MELMKGKKPHAICIPFPAQGHLNPMMQLAKLLHSRGSYITFVNTEFNHRRFSAGSDALIGSNDFQFEVIPDGLSTSDSNATQCITELCKSTQINSLTPLLNLIRRLNVSPDVPQVTCIVLDGVMSFAVQAAQELAIPAVVFWPAAACSFMGFLHFPELVKRGIVPFEDESYLSCNGYLDTPVDWIPGMRDIRVRDLPSYARTTDPKDFMFHFLGEEAQNCLKSSAILFNTFDKLENKVLAAITSKFSHIYTLGPLSMLGQNMPKSQLNSVQLSLWKQDLKCLDWMDKREPKSVVYVNFGSVTLMTDQHLIEFAWGLANSKQLFLWVLRPDIVMGNSAILPQEFIEETKDRGLLLSWCPQDQVLSHPSIGGFLTHCGWNSMVESMCGGVPMICWPYVGEQYTNCRYACNVWGIGLEISNDVKREEVECVIKELMEGEKGKEMRRKALELKENAEKATQQGGSSYCNFDRFINEVLNPRV